MHCKIVYMLLKHKYYNSIGVTLQLVLGLDKICRTKWSTLEMHSLQFDHFYTFLIAFEVTTNGKLTRTNFNQKVT